MYHATSFHKKKMLAGILALCTKTDRGHTGTDCGISLACNFQRPKWPPERPSRRWPAACFREAKCLSEVPPHGRQTGYFQKTFRVSEVPRYGYRARDFRDAFRLSEVRAGAPVPELGIGRPVASPGSGGTRDGVGAGGLRGRWGTASGALTELQGAGSPHAAPPVSGRHGCWSQPTRADSVAAHQRAGGACG